MDDFSWGAAERASLGNHFPNLPQGSFTPSCVSQSLFLSLSAAIYIIQSAHRLLVTINLILFREHYLKQASVFATLARRGLTIPLPPPRHVHPFTALMRLNALEERSP